MLLLYSLSVIEAIEQADKIKMTLISTIKKSIQAQAIIKTHHINNHMLQLHNGFRR